MSFTTIAIISGALLILTTTIFVLERARGRRYAEGVRDAVDKRLDSVFVWVRMHTPVINDRFFRTILHYLTNRFLARILGVVRRVEKRIAQVMHLNRSKAKRMNRSTTAPHEHLSQIARHKREAKLSEAEKHERKTRALEGD